MVNLLCLILAFTSITPLPQHQKQAVEFTTVLSTPIESANVLPVGTKLLIIPKRDLQLALRDLWTEHIFWVRSVVVAAHYKDSKGIAASEAQVVENARTIADAITPFYGQAAADQLFTLLAGHYGAVKEHMEATFAKKNPRSASDMLVSNATELAEFLSSANPHLPKDAVLPLLMAHGGHHMQQNRAISQGDFSNEALVWDAMRNHMHTVADALTNALAAQFPDKVTD